MNSSASVMRVGEERRRARRETSMYAAVGRSLALQEEI
jgi:hypothetical protein